MSKLEADPIEMAFEREALRLAIADIQPLKIIGDTVKKSSKYAQIVASIAEVGIIEPPVVARDQGTPGKYLLLDGHARIEVLKERGDTKVTCLISTDDEAFTYNKRVNRLAIIQEHRMIVKAVERGVPEHRIAKVLNVDVAMIVRKRNLLEGICSEAAELLKDKHIALNTFSELKKMGPMRQIEAAELMIAMNNYTISYAKSLLTVTPQDQLANVNVPKRVRGLTEDQVALMEKESVSLDREFKIAEKSYGIDHLDLVLANGYLGRLLGNARVVRYLAQHHRDILTEFQKMTETEAAA
jgi:RepB plasmid partitioning protein/ParB-like nuclease family protein